MSEKTQLTTFNKIIEAGYNQDNNAVIMMDVI